MPMETDFEVISRRDWHIFFVIDTNAMPTDRIEQLNAAMAIVFDQLRSVQKDYNCEAQIKVAVLTYDSSCRWVSEKPIPLDRCTWCDVRTSNTSDFGAMLSELCFQLHKERMLFSDIGVYMPSVVFVGAGINDSKCWIEAAEYLRRNPWYRGAMRCAISMDPEFSKQWSKVLGYDDGILNVSDYPDLSNALIDAVRIVTKAVAVGWDECELLGEFEPVSYDYPEETVDEPAFIRPMPTRVTTEYGRKKCNLLKSIRKAIAEANGIPYEKTECTFSGHCNGSCPSCDREAAELSRVLSQMAMEGKQINLPSMDTKQLDDFLPEPAFVDTEDGEIGGWGFGW